MVFLSLLRREESFIIRPDPASRIREAYNQYTIRMPKFLVADLAGTRPSPQPLAPTPGDPGKKRAVDAAGPFCASDWPTARRQPFAETDSLRACYRTAVRTLRASSGYKVVVLPRRILPATDLRQALERDIWRCRGAIQAEKLAEQSTAADARPRYAARRTGSLRLLVRLCQCIKISLAGKFHLRTLLPGKERGG